MPVWRTVQGGSREYVTRILHDLSGTVKSECAITAVLRLDNGKVRITDNKGDYDDFDHVILALHGDRAAAILEDASIEERSILSAFRYQSNKAVLHTDKRAMPRQRAAWSAWNVLDRGDNICVTYWMNKLQPLETDEDIFVTLNPLGKLDGVLGTWAYDHPLYDVSTYQAQRDIWSIQGRGNVW